MSQRRGKGSETLKTANTRAYANSDHGPKLRKRRILTLRKKLMILVSVGVFLPIVVLTYMQYRSLADLQNKTKGAFNDGLRQRLTNVEQQMKQRLSDVAAQTLDPLGSIPLSSLSSPAAAAEIEKHFADVKRSHPEIE